MSALGSAVLRAAHVREDAPPWILHDIESVRLLDPSETATIERSMAHWPHEVRAALRLAHAVRARVAEDEAISGPAQGRDHYVILGAGLDSFSWRRWEASSLHVWEIDHPATQTWKRRAMRRAGISEPSNVTYVSTDLVVDRLRDLALPPLATWNWLGVTMYLDKDATARVLKDIASRQRGTVLIVNFLLDPREASDVSDAVLAVARRVLADVSEPLTASYTHREVELLLSTSGFASFQIFDARELTNRFATGRPDLVIASSTLVARATV